MDNKELCRSCQNQYNSFCCEREPVGPKGDQGPKGCPGDDGPTVATGAAGTGAIIPFASGLPVSLTTIAGGLAGIPAFVGFGSSAQGLTLLGSTIHKAE